MLSIKISNLKDGVHNFRFDEPVEKFELEELFFGKMLIEAELQKSHSQLVLNVEIAVNAAFECDRCTREYSSLLKTKYQMVYLFGEETETDSINITYLHHEDDEIHLNNDIRDFTMLAVPMKRLCKEHCKGLCHKCGQDLNDGTCNCPQEDIDPRWQPLLDLKKKLNIK